jgi:hypothetical protein
MQFAPSNQIPYEKCATLKRRFYSKESRWTGGLVGTQFQSSWEMSRLAKLWRGPLGGNIEALGLHDAIIVATSSQTPILRNASPLRMLTLFIFYSFASLEGGLLLFY